MYKNITKNLIFAVAAFAFLISPSYSNIGANDSSASCNNSTIGASSGTTTLEAQWQANTIDITWFNGEDQITPINEAAAECTYDAAIVLPSNTISREGYTFDGWKVKAPAAPNYFEITTTNMTANDTFKFSISASGDFVVECGDDGVLSGTGVGADGKTITRSDTEMAQYTCTYGDAGSHKIRMTGRATGYNSSSGNSASYAAVGFATYNYSGNTPTKIAAISGALAQVFPTLNNGSNDLSQQPRFYGTFRDCTGLISLPSTLFSGVSGAANYMFRTTFAGCSGLTSLPSGLFNGISGAASSMFHNTFYDCTNLTTVPYNLFAGASGTPGNQMFYYTFYNNTKLNTFVLADGSTVNYVPDGFFGSITGNAEKGMSAVFYGNMAIASSCPANMTQAYTEYASKLNGRVACKAN